MSTFVQDWRGIYAAPMLAAAACPVNPPSASARALVVGVACALAIRALMAAALLSSLPAWSVVALLVAAVASAVRAVASSASRARQLLPRCFGSPLPHSALRERSAASTADLAAATASASVGVNFNAPRAAVSRASSFLSSAMSLLALTLFACR